MAQALASAMRVTALPVLSSSGAALVQAASAASVRNAGARAAYGLLPAAFLPTTMSPAHMARHTHLCSPNTSPRICGWVGS
jgi:hypothetical protein